MTSSDEVPLLRLDRISKRYGNTIALDNVNLALNRGEVIGLIGENGAGKSTLMKVLAGVVAPDSGEIVVGGHAEHWRSPGQAIDAGIALIHQELSLHDNLSVAENLYLGREPVRLSCGPLSVIDRKMLRGLAETQLARVGLSEVRPNQSVGELSIAAKQLIEIARALSMNARIIVMDEPTSSLSHEEAATLLDLVGKLQQEGVAVIYISHRLHEITLLASRVEVLRDGQHVQTLTGEQIEHDTMVRAMVGRDLASRAHAESPKSRSQDSPRLVVDNLKVQHAGATPVSFQVNPGEVVAIAGLMGAGRTEILETIFGIRPSHGGEVRVDGKTVRGGVAAAIAAGLTLVPEDRKQTGLLIDSDVRDNLTLIAMTSAGRLLSRGWQQKLATELVSSLRIKTESTTVPVGSLSGGNQQKVALAKWLATEFAVLMLDEPTRGVDIGAKAEIYQQIDQIAAEGKSVLVVSSELEEIFAIADRVLVVASGAIVGELSGQAMNEEAIMQLAVSH